MVAPLGLAGVLIAGCSTIHSNESLDECPEPSNVLMEATTNKSEADYSEYTDPAILSAESWAIARKEIDEASNFIYISRTAGIGEVACIGVDDQIYLTDEGLTISQSLQED